MNVSEAWRIVERDLGHVRSAISDVLPPLDELEKEIAGETAPDEDS